MNWLSNLAHSSSAFGKVAFALVIVTLFLAVIGGLLLLVDRAPKKGKDKFQAALFLLPAFVLLGIGLLGPIVSTAVSSMTSADVRLKRCIPSTTNSCIATKGGRWNNLANWKWAIGDSGVHDALLNTIKWTVIAPVLATAIGLIYATVIDKVRRETLAKTLVFLPSAISFVGASVIWGLMYKQPSENAPAGLVNVVLNWVGLGPINFPTNSDTTTYWLIVIMIWIQAGFATVVLSAAIKGVPTEMIEASKLDGANAWQTFRQIVVPSIRSSLIVVLVTISVATLKVFDLVQAFGAQQHGGDTLANLMFTTWKQAGISAGNGGTLGDHRSATLAMIIFVLVIPFVGFQVRQMLKARAAR